MNLSEVFLGRPDLLADENKLKSVFADFYNGEAPRINRMMKAYEIGILDTIISDEKNTFDKQKLIDKLVSQHDMVDSKAKEAIDEWYKIVTMKVVVEYRKYLTERQQKEADHLVAIVKREQVEIEKQAKQKEEKKSLEGKTGDLNVEYDNYNRYMNLDLTKGEVVRGIPCGVGDSDYGFIVHGTGREDVNDIPSYTSLHALVYNFLIRDTHIEREKYPQYMNTRFFNHELDYGHVYRFMMILIDLLKPSGETVLYLNVRREDRDEITAAVDILNEYLSVFARLIKAELCSISVIDDPNGKTISAAEKADYWVENYTSDHGLRRRLRYGNRVNYKLDKNDKNDLEFLLKEISPFQTFKRGQFDALCSMMNTNGHAVCIMPTGSGKSLIYYFACLLQPQVVFVVSPTDILIRDQIRNLRKFHHFDNVTHLNLQPDNDFSFFKPGTNLIFLTPATFQNRNLFGVFKRWKKEISYVVLDEIHCLSNWGHDFRPEYLMLSRNMSQYLRDARYLGFTATANYTVAQDIQKQLDIPLENFFSPVLIEKYNIKYDFREMDDTEAMLNQVKEIAADIVHRNERAIVFTKSDEISVIVADAIGYEADVFTSENSESYNQFAQGLCRILVTNEELGIGINLPNVNCTVHFGMPVSKNEFVQEIGRAGRADEKVTAYVVYLKPSEENILAQLLRRETVIDNLPQILKAMNNDYSEIYHKLNCGADTSDILYDRLIDIYSDFHSGKKTAYIVDYPAKSVETYKQFLYMLYVTGYVKDWYTYRAIDEEKQIEIIVDICSAPNVGHSVIALDDASILTRMKKIARDYFASMGNNRECVFNVSRANQVEDVFKVYVKWYYDNFLYHHKEQFLDFFEFITNNKECNSVKITEEIEDFFVLPFIQIKEDEEYYSNLSIAEISEKVISGIGKNTLSNLERINSNSYSFKLDYLLFIGNWNRSGRFEVNRLERIWYRFTKEEKMMLVDTLVDIYPECSKDAQWNCLKYLDDRNNITNIKLQTIVDRVYEKTPKDILYYGILAKCANEKFREFIRS
ncbi:MAG: RecQ family ATP-dependent helicase [Anaerocolumna sp.]|nr:RecQ family ATP-dependent helicase [Anaerocolumna sp.]